MKAVAFVCLLSLSLCLTQSTSVPDAHPSQAASAKTDDKASTPKPLENSTVATVVHVVTIAGDKPTEHTKLASPPPSPNDTKQDAKTTEVKTEKTPEQMVPKQNGTKPEEAEKKEATVKPTEAAKPTDAPKPTEQSKAVTNGTVTVTPATERSTETPKDTTEIPLVGKRGFDGASFIGGIILTLGLLAIGFMGFKYYKNQTERNYHTL